MRGFIDELRRRKVHRAAALYVVGGYATIEASALLAPLLELPDWSVRLVLVLVVVGFPLAMAVAWIFQITPAGLERTPPEPAAERVADRTAGRHGGDNVRGATTSILVAPITNQSPEPDTEYIADGLTDEIITDLSQIPSLRVISRASTMRLKSSGADVADTARDLGIDYLLDGSVRKSGDDLRITLRLVHLESEESRWSERYTGTLRDLFGIHEKVAHSVAQALTLHASPTSGVATDRRDIEDPRAVESYLRARYETWKFSRSGLEQAERHLKNGLEIVGESALLYGTLGHVYAWYSQLGLDPRGEYLQQAAECAERVFQLEPDSARGHWLGGMVRFQAGDLRAARAPLERALLGTPSDPDTLMMLGYLSALCGQHERALELFRRGMGVDPLTPLNSAMPGFIAVLEGRAVDAFPYYRKYRERDPHSPFAAWCWIWVLLYDGQVEEAESPVGELVRAHPDSLFSPLGAALFHGARGDRDGVLGAVTDELRQAARTSELFSRELTNCLASVDAADEALHWLENTIRIGNVNHPFWSEHDPWLAKLRPDPRFSRLMVQVEREWRSLNPELAG